MSVRKLSIPVPPEVEETIKAAAAEEGKPVSAWLAEAAVEKAQVAVLPAWGRAACGVSGTSDVVDAIVVTTAVRHQAAVVTSEPDDLKQLADSLGVKLRLFIV